ncbi:MAG TPA: sugar transferase, partial [Gemmatimonadaceae bacterium]|nr:sugar transferase [Gemmatimonadaceae bacterium]
MSRVGAARSTAASRAIDLLLALPALVVLAPAFVLIAVAIRLDSPGSVFYRQERVGLHGAPFRIHKFRSMRAAADGPAVTVAGDIRVTRIGAHLRKWKVDELPQLIDVVRGTMSLVGPRPELPAYVALWPAEARDVILSVRPGITDPASVAFRNESEVLASA